MLVSLKKFSRSKSVKEFMLIMAAGVINGFFICPSCTTNHPALLFRIILVCCFVWFIMWKGNSYTNKIVDLFYSWLKEPVKRLVVGVAGHVVYTLLATVGIYYGLDYFFSVQIGNLWYTATFSVCIALLISLVLHSRSFLFSWRMLAIESEKIKKEAISSKYETLKNQVNPHFLFNSLNALTNLVYEDQDLAAKFIKKLSDVYRYVLESKDKEIISLHTELEFVRSYIFLQKIRYEQNLIVDISIEKEDQYFIIPLSLQMLVENAIKHNEVSEEKPLRIRIYEEEGFLIIRNTLQKKNILNEGSSQVGLANIKARYSFLSDTQVVVQKSAEDFIVKLPLLEENVVL